MTGSDGAAKIDRYELVSGHDVVRTGPDPLEPLSVGNGELAFTVDVTGLQSLDSFHRGGMQLGTKSQWAWHTAPNLDEFDLDDSYEDYSSADGRAVPYLTTGDNFSDTAGSDGDRRQRAQLWLRENPHRLDLGRIGFVDGDGRPLDVHQLRAISQRLDLWRGRIVSQFRLADTPVEVITVCHPDRDVLAMRIRSRLLAAGDLAVAVGFSYAIGDWTESSDWTAPDRHSSEVSGTEQRRDVRRVLDADVHHVALVGDPRCHWEQCGPHELRARPGSDTLDLVVAFAPQAISDPLPSAAETIAAAERHWERFWTTGGAIDLAGSTDARATELERRIVLSQYLTAINCAGSTPPAETGLVMNSWRGKFHLEMHWWHAAHFPLWGRTPLLERSLGWYARTLPLAREYARKQGYGGARWPKQIGPEGRESPSDIGALLIWQQPHPIYYAELVRRERPDKSTLNEFADIVFDTARFMASYAVHDGRHYALGPPLTSAQEKAYRLRHESRNPAFELAYWRWGLLVAQQWREHLGLPRDPQWDAVAAGLAPLPIRAGRYVELEHPVTEPDGHPTMVGALGFVPDVDVVDRDVMRTTLRHVLDSWELPETWGWDYPLLAMTACRLDEPELAIDALLMESPKNRYLANGHNFQRPGKLPLYLPGNGGVLYATAMMAGGWDGAPRRPTPGFPKSGWHVRAEGLRPAP